MEDSTRVLEDESRLKLTLAHTRLIEEDTTILNMINSPVTDLTHNLEELSTGGKSLNFARRNLSMVISCDQLTKTTPLQINPAQNLSFSSCSCSSSSSSNDNSSGCCSRSSCSSSRSCGFGRSQSCISTDSSYSSSYHSSISSSYSSCAELNSEPDSNEGSRAARKQLSVDYGCCVESCSPDAEDSPFILNNSVCCENGGRPSLLKRHQSHPVPFHGFELTPPLEATAVGSRFMARMCKSDSSKLNEITSPLYVPGVKALCEGGGGAEGDKENAGCSMSHADRRFDVRRRLTSPSKARLVDSTNTCADQRVLADSTAIKDSSSIRTTHSSSNMRQESSRRFQSFKSLPMPFSRSERQLTSLDSLQCDVPKSSLPEAQLEDAGEPVSSCPKSLGALFFSPLLEVSGSSLDVSLSPSACEDSPTQTTDDTAVTMFRTPSAPNMVRNTANKGWFGAGKQMNRLKVSVDDSTERHRRRFKRSESQREDCTPQQIKRCRGSEQEEGCVMRGAPLSSGRRRLQRCHSEAELIIKKALSWGDSQDLVGDFSKSYCLPLITSKHQDLKAISSDTLADLLNNEYKEIVERFVIIDSRYPYEFTGGHILGAENFYLKEDIVREFFDCGQYKIKSSNESSSSSSSNHLKRVVFIFHCEFSSHRGPELSRFLRNRDRDLHKDIYPQLFYPELYLLDGGYKGFHERFPHLCTPQGYVPMLHENHIEDLKHFRAKTSSWVNEKYRGGVRGAAL